MSRKGLKLLNEIDVVAATAEAHLRVFRFELEQEEQRDAAMEATLTRTIDELEKLRELAHRRAEVFHGS